MYDDEKDVRGRDPIWDILKDHAKAEHAERVAKTPDRVQYAMDAFQRAGIKYVLKNVEIGHFHCWRKADGKLFQFWAGTGKIMGYDRARGISALIRILEKACWIEITDPETGVPAHRCSTCGKITLGARALPVCPFCLSDMTMKK